ncbi:hypothetical protein GGR64_000877 [Xanthomonas arboricola]|nr:hypothetical protein [Xanthomonas sp. 3307]
MTSHSAVLKRFFWLLFFAQAKKSDSRVSAKAVASRAVASDEGERTRLPERVEINK